MTDTTQATVAVATPDFAKRKARALIGWLTPEEGALWLAGRDARGAANALLVQRANQLRAAVAARPIFVEQPGALMPLPPEVDPHIAAFAAHPWGARILAESGRPMLVDLTKIRALQPIVKIDEARARVASVNPNDMPSIAAITIPIPDANPVDMPAMFDQAKQAWILASPNPNLRVVAPFSGVAVQIAPGLQVGGLGFAIALMPSVLNVVGIGGRYFLADGYHRAIGLLESGITKVPALVRECATTQDARLPTAGLLSADIFLGDRPPLLPDYLNDAVSAETMSPLVTKMIVIQALEVSPLG